MPSTTAPYSIKWGSRRVSAGSLRSPQVAANAVSSTVAGVLVALLVGSGGAVAQTSYPDRAIRVIVSFPPGGLTDNSARVIAEKFSARLGQPIVIENRPGAAGNIGTQQVAQAAPDGYTLLLGADSVLAINPHIYPKMPFDTVRDFAPVSLLGTINLTIVAHPSSGVKTARDLIDLARRKPGAISYGSAGIGASGHLVVELLRLHTGIELTHVPYKGGGPAMQDVVAGQIPIVGTGLPGAVSFIKQGRVIALGVSSVERDPAVPDVPTFIEAGVPGMVANAWTGIFAPAATPRPIIDRLGRELREVLADREVKERYASIGIIARHTSPEELAEVLRVDLEKWRAVVQRAKIKIE